ncbi:MAG: hypothetical protein EZS28_044805, partial [Streblomastix strix]
INIPYYLSKEYQSQSPHGKSRRNESIRIYEREKNTQQTMGKELKGRDQKNNSLKQKRKRNRVVVVVVAVVAVAVAVTARKYRKIGQGKETRQFCESMETRTGWRMMNATNKWRK